MTLNTRGKPKQNADDPTSLSRSTSSRTSRKPEAKSPAPERGPPVKRKGRPSQATPKVEKKVAFNDHVRTVRVESYKRYNLPEEAGEGKPCCSKACALF